jgi:spore cortex formation protein SpoVR/YcgB (stage V sporulation)
MDNSEEKFGSMTIDDQIIENKTYLVRSKKVKDVVNWLARARNNYGVPCVVVRRIDEAGMLRLEHLADDTVNLDLSYAEHVLKYVGKAWGRPVELIRREKGRTWVLSYDGVSFAVDHQSSDYPDVVEANQTPSSW